MEELAKAVENLDIPVDGAALVQALALRDRLDACITAAVGTFDAAGLWDLDAATSMAAWPRASAGMTSRSAGRLSLVSRRLHGLPATSTAHRGGTLSGGQIEAIVAPLDDDTVDLFADHDAELVPYLAPLTVAGVARAMVAWRVGAKPEPAEAAEPERTQRLSKTLDDRYQLDGSLDPEGGAIVSTALRTATSDDGDSSRTCATRRAGALVDICRFFLDHQKSKAGSRNRPHVNVVVDMEALALGEGGRVVDGPPLDGATMSKMMCDCALHRVVMAGRSGILDYGVATRTIQASLWSALVVRDEHCRFPGCDRPSQWCEGHHVIWVINNGTTELANVILLCALWHHHRVHQPGWRAMPLPDGTFEVTDPNGLVRVTSPPRMEPAW